MNTVSMKKWIKKIIPAPLLPKIQKAHLDLLWIIYIIKSYLKGFYIDYMVISVGQACNYKCRDCANFCPIAPREYKRYSLESIISSLKPILNSVKYIERIQIQGGEPFVYSELGGVLKYIGKQKNKVHVLTIATNGSIVPSDDLMRIMHDNDVKIRISNYGRSLDKLAELTKKCDEFDVQYSMYDFATGKTQWFQCGGVDVKREQNKHTVKKRFNNCRFNTCLTLERGELSHCSRATNSYHIQGFQRKDRDYLKVRNDKNFKNRLRKYVLFLKPMEACHYCYGTSMDHMIPVAVQEGES